MVEEPVERLCDVDDLLCQMTALSHLKGLKNVLGDEKYQTEFPELQSLDAKITSRESELREALGKCGLSPMEAPEGEIGDQEDRTGAD